MIELTAVDLFKDLPPAVLAELASGASLTACLDGATIFQRGDAAEHVYAITSGPGRVRIGSVDDNGKTLMVEVCGVGESFGELAVLDQGPRSADALVEGRLQLLRIRAAVFLRVLETAPGLGVALCHALAHRLRRTFSLLEGATFDSVEQRLARQILYLGDRHGRSVPRGLRLLGRYRQPDLADLLGVTVRSIITVLNTWRELGLVEYDTASAQMTIANREALAALAHRRDPPPETGPKPALAAAEVQA